MTQHYHIYGIAPTVHYGTDTVWLHYGDAKRDFRTKLDGKWQRLQFDQCKYDDCLTDPHFEHPYQKEETA